MCLQYEERLNSGNPGLVTATQWARQSREAEVSLAHTHRRLPFCDCRTCMDVCLSAACKPATEVSSAAEPQVTTHPRAPSCYTVIDLHQVRSDFEGKQLKAVLLCSCVLMARRGGLHCQGLALIAKWWGLHPLFKFFLSPHRTHTQQLRSSRLPQADPHKSKRAFLSRAQPKCVLLGSTTPWKPT